jgi:hypothetical protein
MIAFAFLRSNDTDAKSSKTDHLLFVADEKRKARKHSMRSEQTETKY